MSASAAVSPSAVASAPVSTPTAYPIPGALQQFLDKMEGCALEYQHKAMWDDPGKHHNVHLRACERLRNLKEEVESKWQVACVEGNTSSAMLAEILEGGWKEWKKIAAYVQGTPLRP